MPVLTSALLAIAIGGGHSPRSRPTSADPPQESSPMRSDWEAANMSGADHSPQGKATHARPTLPRRHWCHRCHGLRLLRERRAQRRRAASSSPGRAQAQVLIGPAGRHLCWPGGRLLGASCERLVIGNGLENSGVRHESRAPGGATLQGMTEISGACDVWRAAVRTGRLAPGGRRGGPGGALRVGDRIRGAGVSPPVGGLLR